MRSFFRFFAERHTLANLMTIVVILLGLNALMQIQRDQYPKVDYGQINILTHYSGASPEDVELNVTNKIEDELISVIGIQRMTSVSMENVSSIDVIIDPDVNQDEVKRAVRDAVGRVSDLPQEVTDTPLITEIKSSMFMIIEVGISGDLPYRELRELARLFEKKLKAISGVARVDRVGYRAREIQVEIRPEALDQYQISFGEVISAIGRRNIRSTAGTLESYTTEKNLVTLAHFREPMEVGDVIIRSTPGDLLIKVKDLAIVKDDFEEERVFSRINGKSAISFVVRKSESADIIRTVDAIKKLIDIESKNLPEGVEILYSNDVSHYVRNRLDVVVSNGLMGLVLVVIMLTVFLNLRTAFWVALGIPVTLMGVIFLMPFFDVYLDSISLASMILVLGILVDDAIIISENIYRRREQGDSPLAAAVEGVREVAAPVVTTILTTFLAFAPMFFLSGQLGKFVFVIPLVVSLALFISLLEGFLILPSHLVPGLHHYSEGNGESGRHRWFNVLKEHYQRLVVRLLRFRYLLMVWFIIVLLGSLWYAGNFMKFILFPTSGADRFYVLIELPTGTPLHATSDKVLEIEAQVANLPDDELDSFITRVGTQPVGTGQVVSENYAFISVSLTPFAERSRTADQIVSSLRKKTNQLAGYTKIAYVTDAGGPAVGKPIEIRIAGAEDELRTKLADSVETFLATIEGVTDVERDDKPGKDQVEIQIDYDKLALLGLTVADVAQNLRTAYDGEIVSRIRYGDEDVNFRVKLSSQATNGQKDLNELLELLIPNRKGELVKLKSAASFQIGPGTADYRHYDGERTVTVTAELMPDTTTPLAVTRAVFDHFNLGGDWPGMRFVVGGEAEETQKSMRSLLTALGFAAIGIYFLLILLFNSMTQPFLVMIAIPFGISGVIIAFAFHGEPLGFVAMMGVIGLSGVVVNDSLVMFSHINQLVRERPDERTLTLVAEGAANRLRPVIITTLTTAAGLIPLAYGIGGSDPVMAPMALALGYGLLFATPLTLVLVPCLYLMYGDLGKISTRIVSSPFFRGSNDTIL